MNVLLILLIATVTIKTLPKLLEMVYSIFEKFIEKLNIAESEKQTVKEQVRFLIDGLSDLAQTIENLTKK